MKTKYNNPFIINIYITFTTSLCLAQAQKQFCYNRSLEYFYLLIKRRFFLVFVFNLLCLITLAQADYGVFVGSGVWWSECNDPVINEKKIAEISFSPLIDMGIFYRQNFKSKFTVEGQINYQKLYSNYSYKSSYPHYYTYDPDYNYYYILWDDKSNPMELRIIDGKKVILSNVVGEEASTTNYHKIEIPLQIGLIIKKFNPFIGLKYSFKMYKKSVIEVEDNGNYITGYTIGYPGRLNTFQHSIGFVTGINYKIIDRLTLKFNFYSSFTKDYDYVGYLFHCNNCNSGEIVSKKNYFWKTKSIEISVLYSFKKSKITNDIVQQ